MGDIIITSAEDLAAARLNAKRLIAIWNALTAKKKITKVGQVRSPARTRREGCGGESGAS